MDVWSEEWNQRQASSRSLVTMRRIAQDAQVMAGDHGQLEQYALKYQLTINEIIYYLNAYEYGEDEGLEAIRNPDIIPADTALRAVRSVTAALNKGLTGDTQCRVTDEGTQVGVYEISQHMNKDIFLFPICRFRLTLASHHWHLYWMRKFGAWWPHPLPKSGRRFTLKARVQQLLDDEFGCFWL